MADLPVMPINNLPLQLTRFIGREGEITVIKQLLTQRARLVTLTGVGGSGKTRLAIEVARSLITPKDASGLLFPDGVWFIGLDSLSDPALVPQVIAGTLNLLERAGLTPIETLVQALRSRNILLLLDNCEVLIEACARLSETLLQACPYLTILTTSRAPLNTAGEAIFPVPPLEILNPDDQLPLTNLGQSESVCLFVDRATAARPDFVLTKQNVLAVTQICRQLDGLPLAIELAAARTRMLTPQQIVRRMDEVLSLLRSTSPTTLPRHQNLQAAFGWSHALLGESERVLFRRLSVFSGGWVLSAAEQVASDDHLAVQDVFSLHERLLDQSLITRMDDGLGERARYRLLEPLRQYAAEKRVEADEADQLYSRHLDWCLDLAEEAEPAILRLGQVAWFTCLEAELPNIRAALGWSLEAQALERGLRLASALWPFWEMRSYLSEGRDWLEKLLAQSGPLLYLLQSRTSAPEP